ncbi:MAG: SAV_6107 family HEPN domain-containing protein [Promicromonosporaceae bacterium]|nr:SAV_6107 family HEPN domain-containing protein [Promicromonosporaceae bacterium]
MPQVVPIFRASASAKSLLETCDVELGRAAVALDPADRYIAAHLAAVHAACAFIDLIAGKPDRNRRSVWERLVAIDRNWQPWAAYFAGGTKLRRALEIGVPVASKVADEMTAHAEDFRDEIAMAIDPACEWPSHVSVPKPGYGTGIQTAPSPTTALSTGLRLAS